MAKRFTDTDKWKKPFFRGLDAPYKALWLYILDDCDIAGIWIVDFEVAKIRVGQDITEAEAIKKFAGHIQVFDSGRRWFIRDFTDFQYGPLKETNRMHLAVLGILKTANIEQGASKGLPSPQGQGQGEGNGKGQGQGEGQDETFDEKFIRAFDEITCERFMMTFPNIPKEAFGRELQAFRTKCDNDQQDYHRRDLAGLRHAFQYQLKNYRPNGKRQATKQDIQSTVDEIIRRRNSKGTA